MDAIAAMSVNRVIGKDGKLPWPSIKEDFQHFRRITMGKTLIVGNTTYKTLPPLKGRNLYVVTRNSRMWGAGDFKEVDWRFFGSPENAPEDGIVCGGAEIYSLLLPRCQKLYLTTVYEPYEGDTVMPPFEHLFNPVREMVMHVPTKFGIETLYAKNT